jgi:hypothetical protein
MPNPMPAPERGQGDEAQQFYQTLKANDQIRDVGPNEDTTRLPNHVTHVRYPDGTIRRIRFASSGYR